MTKDETGFEVIEAKLAELYQFQWGRLDRLATTPIHYSSELRSEVAEARKILSEWLWCLEAKDRARCRDEGKARLD